MSKRLTMTDDEAMHVLGYTNPSGRYKFSDEEKWKEAIDKRDEFRLGSKTNQYKRVDVLTAFDDNGKLMDIDQYCSYYNIPREQVRSFKLVTHTGLPYYNIASGNVEDEDLGLTIDEVKELLKQDISYTPIKRKSEGRIIVVSLADLHIGSYVDNLVKTKSFSIGKVVEL